MADSPQQHETDIVDEAYRGPHPGIVALGNGVIKHLKWALIGLTGGAAFALVFHKFSAQSILSFRERAETLCEQPKTGKLLQDAWGRVKQATGNGIFAVFGEGDHIKSITAIPSNPRHADWVSTTLTNKQHGFGYWILSHTFGFVPLIGKPIKRGLAELGNGNYERFSNAITFGGVAGAGGYVSGWLVALLGGASQGYASKDQYDRLRTELINARSLQSGDDPPIPPISAAPIPHPSHDGTTLAPEKPTEPKTKPAAPSPAAPHPSDAPSAVTQDHTAAHAPHHPDHVKSTIDAASVQHTSPQQHADHHHHTI